MKCVPFDFDNATCCFGCSASFCRIYEVFCSLCVCFVNCVKCFDKAAPSAGEPSSLPVPAAPGGTSLLMILFCCVRMRSRQQTGQKLSVRGFWGVISRVINVHSHKGQQHDRTTGWKLAGDFNQTDLRTVLRKQAYKRN